MEKEWNKFSSICVDNELVKMIMNHLILKLVTLLNPLFFKFFPSSRSAKSPFYSIYIKNPFLSATSAIYFSTFH